jgi:hypothetical protein
MPWKTTDDGQIATVEADGAHHPVWLKDDGSEEPYDPGHAETTIVRLNSENANRRRAAEKAEIELKSWRALETEPDKVRELLESASSKSGGGGKSDHKDLDRVKEQVAAEYQKRLDALGKELEATKERMSSASIGGKFAASAWFSGEKPKTILPPDIAQTYFGRHFRVEEDGTVAGYLDPGTFEQRITIEKGKRIGEPAGFDEAVEILIDRRADKDRLLAASGVSGSGAPSNGHKTTTTTQDVSKLPPSKRLEIAFKQGAAAR